MIEDTEDTYIRVRVRVRVGVRFEEWGWVVIKD